MQKIPAIIITCLLLSCSSFKGEQGKIYDKLQVWDKILYEKPEEILDSLATLSSQDLSKKNRAYYSLLLTIARNKADITEKDDSVISVAVDWYKKRKDYRNTCRSILYKGLVINRRNLLDTMLYYNLLEAERIFYKNNIKDNDFKSQIHTVLGHSYRFNKLYPSEEIRFDKTYKIPEKHFTKSITINTKLKNQEEIQKVKLEMFEIKALQKKEKEALAILNSLRNPDSLSLRIKYELFRAYDSYYTFYASKKEKNLTKSIEYLKKVIEIRKIAKVFEPSLSSFYRAISDRYMQIDKPDSALVYNKIALKLAEENDEKTVFAHYKYLSDAFASNGDYKSALENSRKVLPSYLSASTKAEKKSLLNIKKELTKTKNSLTKAKMTGVILGITIFLLLICSSIIIFRLRKKYWSTLLEHENALSQISTLKGQLIRTNFINQIHETTIEALPRLVDDINKHANRSRKFSSELSDDMNDSLNNIRSLSKDNLSVLAHSENFISANPNVKYLTTLSDMEIVVLILYDLKFSSKEISELLSNSQSSVRSMKTRIKGKILAMEGLPYDPINTFSIFSKDHNHRD